MIVLFVVVLLVNGLVGLEDQVSIPGRNKNDCPCYHLQSIRGANPAPTSSGGGSSVRAAGLNSPRNVKNQNKYRINVFFRTRKETFTEILVQLFSKLLGWLQPFSTYGRVDLVIW
jgi:hypothetical protein